MKTGQLTIVKDIESEEMDRIIFRSQDGKKNSHLTTG